MVKRVIFYSFFTLISNSMAQSQIEFRHFIPQSDNNTSQWIDLSLNKIKIQQNGNEEPTVTGIIDFSNIDLNKNYCATELKQLPSYKDYPRPDIRSGFFKMWELFEDDEKDYYYAEAETQVQGAYFFATRYDSEANPLRIDSISELPMFQFYYHPGKKCWEGAIIRSSLGWYEDSNSYALKVLVAPNEVSSSKRRKKIPTTEILVSLSTHQNH